MKQKHLAVALSAIFATVALTGCGSDNDNNYAGTTPPVVTPETPETPEVPEVPEVPGGDNSDNPGNAAEGTSDLRTQTTVGGQQYVRQDGSKFDLSNNTNTDNDANSTVLNTITLQNKKLNNIVLGRETVNVLDSLGQPILGTDGKPKTQRITRYIGNATGSFQSTGTNDDLQEYNEVVIYTGTYDNIGATTNHTGLIFSDVNTSKLAPSVGSEERSDEEARIFGKNFDYADSNVAKNSYKFTAKNKANGTLDISNLTDANNFTTTNLKNVQYGRVTSIIEPLNGTDVLEADVATGKYKDYYESKVVDKGTANSVDTYFYRGTNETSIDNMAALKEAGGTFQYSGHALMYGIDNSYHNEKSDPNSNSFGGATTGVTGKGNFVEATVNMTDRDIKGNVFNVWQVTPEVGGTAFRKDNVVDFKGDIFGNTFKGDANLSYDKNNKGTVKGSFYGDKAQEIGGAFNSVTSGYGQSQWGGVFGAERVTANGNENETENK